MHWRAILRDLGAFVMVPAVLVVPAALVCGVFGEWRLLPGFGITAAISVGLGLFLRRDPGSRKQTHSLTASMVTIGAAWLAIGVIAAIPFLYWGGVDGAAMSAARPFRQVWSALFESMSGITSTGLTMASDASRLPRAIQMWRTLLEWVGGVGIVILALAVIRPAEASRDLFAAEAREERIAPTFQSTAKRMWRIYGVLTMVSVAMFAAVGMPFWEALNHGMTGIATGGFTVTSDSFAGYGNGVLLAGSLIMLLGAVSFHTYGRIVWERDWRGTWREPSLIVLLGSVVIGVGFLRAIHAGAGAGFVTLLFQWVSALGTCGFQSAPLGVWAGPSMLLLTLAMFVGGAAGSTTGGIKVDRAILVVLGPLWHMRQRLSTRKGVQYYVIDGKKVREADALRRYRGAVVLTSLFAGTIFVGTLVLLLAIGRTYEPYQVLFEVTSAMSNVGLSAGITSASLPWVAKMTMIFIMWMGRLEITAVLVLIGLPLVWTTRRRRRVG